MALSSLLLDVPIWDLTLNGAGNMAVVEEPDSLPQDAASGIQAFEGEYYWDTTLGVPWFQKVLGASPPPTLPLLKQIIIEDGALPSNPDIAAAQVFISSFSNRGVSGQVQVAAAGSAAVLAANFSVVNPQGAG